MIKIFNANDRDFSTAGNIIIEPIKCIEYKKKSLNGWYIEVEIPIKYKEYISKDKLCVVKTKSKLNPQAFRIGEDIEYSTRKIKFQANHVMFDSKDYVLLDVRPTNQNGLNALNYINERTDNLSPFSIYSNVENVNTAYFIRKNLLEAWTTIEERWGGVFDADNWNISFLTSVGNDNGETIAYGKNMQGFDIYEDWSSVCTKLLPVGYDGLLLPETYLESDVQYEKPYTRVVDFQTNLETEEQTEENLLSELRRNAEAYLEENKVPKVSYTIISNVNQTLEIGDTIKVLHPFVNLFTEVLEYEYDIILGKVKSLTFGNYNRDVKTKFENIKNSITQINQALSKQEIAINTQTNLINMLNKNGYVYIDDNEILILDTLPKETAKNVWRFGLGGIGFSSNGYEGPFETAITMDGQINADFITTGTLNVSRIEGLSNFISETEKQISQIEINQGNITTRVEKVETNVSNLDSKVDNEVSNLQSQIDGQIQFWNGESIPTINNYPATEWTTEEQRNNHRADIYTVIEDVDGELKQGKSYRFDKVETNWVWVELTDNELSAVQALAQSKAKVFTAIPKPPYNVGDLWIKDQELYECKTAKDSNGVFAQSDWQKATKYTDDTVANLANLTANTALYGVNNITTTQATLEGTEIKIDDSAEEPILELGLDGKSTQATRSGKNKFDLAKVNTSTAVSLNDTGINIKNVWAHTIINSVNLIQMLKPSTTYTCYSKSKVKNRPSYTSTSNHNDVLILYKQGVGGKKLSVIDKTLDTEQISVKTFTTPDDLDGWSMLGYTFHGNNDGSTTYTGIGEIEVKDLMIVEGTYTAETIPDFEQYGASPSPEFPSEIKSVGDEGTVTIEQRGKNLFDASKIGNTDIVVSNNGQTITMPIATSENGYTTTNKKLSELCPSLKVGDKVILRFNTTSAINKYIHLLGITYTWVVNEELTITEKALNGYVLLYANNYIGGETEQVTITDMSIMLSNEINIDYEPYFSKDYVLPTAPLRSLPNGTKDTIEEDGIHRRVGSVVLDGSTDETYGIAGEGNTTDGFSMYTTFVIENISNVSNKSLRSNYFTFIERAKVNSTSINFITGGAGKSIVLNIDRSLLETEDVAGFKKWLQSNPIQVNYELAEEVVEPFTDEQLEVIQSIETNLYTQYFICDANMRITYVRNNGLADMYETKDSAIKKYTETEQKISELDINVNGIFATVGDVTTRLENDYMTTDQIEAETGTLKDDVDIIKKQQASVELTSKGLQVQIDSINNNGVKVVKNTLVDIDEEGIKVSKGSEFNSLLDDTGVYLKSYDKEIASYTKDGAKMYNLTVENEAIIGNLRCLSVEVDGEKRTHIHWIGG